MVETCWCSVENQFIRILLDPATGAVRELLNKRTGDNYIKKTGVGQKAPFVLTFLDYDNRKRTLVPVQAASFKRDKQGREGRCEDRPGGPREVLTVSFESLVDGMGTCWPVAVDMTVELGPDDEEAIWHLRVANNAANLKIVEVLFPCITGVWIGESHEDDWIVYPHHAGEKTGNPIREYASARYLGFSRAETRVEDGVFSREINYCGLASMMWMDYYDASGALYLASYDDEHLLTGVRVETGGPEDPWIGFSFRKYAAIPPGATWHSKPYAVAIHQGDWHWGARRYRSWFEKGRSYADQPDDLREQSALCPRYDFRRDDQVLHTFAEIPDMYEKARREGITHIFISGWNRRGFDNNYPEYFPDMELGTPLDLERGVRYVNEHGGMVTFYINARIFDILSDYFPTLGVAWALKDEKGRWVKETYHPRSFSVCCPACEEWQRRVVDYATCMVRWYGARGIYLDQLGSATPYPCYDPQHNHEHHATFNQGYLEMLKKVLAAIRSERPDAFIMIENCGDIYGQYVFANLTWNGELYDEFFNVYKYTFPRYIQVNMVNPRRIPVKDERHRWFYRDVERALLIGSILWAELGDRFGPEDGELREYLRRVLRVREACARDFSSLTFIDDEGIRFDPRIRATHWQGHCDGRRVDLVVTARGVTITEDGPVPEVGDDLTVAVDVPPERVEKVEAIALGGMFEAWAFSAGEDGLQVPVPGTALGAIRIVSRPAGA